MLGDRRLVSALVLSIALCGAQIGRAQLRGETTTVALPPVAYAGSDEAYAVAYGPAMIGFLPSWSVDYVHADAGSQDPLVGRGDALFAATPVLFGVAAGASIESVRPTVAAGELSRSVFSLALAYAPSRTLSFGGSLRILSADSAVLDGVVSADLGAAYRPWNWLALSLVARDVTAPRIDFGRRDIDRSVMLAAALRPFGVDALTLDLAGAVNEDGRVDGRAALEIPIPYIGRIGGAAELRAIEDDRELLVTAGLEIDWDAIGAGGGVIWGQGFRGAPGWYANAHLEGTIRHGIPIASSILEVEVGSASERAIPRAVLLLERALEDDAIRGVLLKPRAGLGLANAQEIRMMVDALQRAGKPVVCHLESATGSELYSCARARRILIDPGGNIRLVGTASEGFLIGDFLSRIGVRSDFVRIGDYKSAVEQYMNGRSSGPARRANTEFLDQVFARLVHDLALDMRLPERRVREIIDGGPYLAEGALEAGLVAATSDEIEIDEELVRVFGSASRTKELPSWRPNRWGDRPRIGVVVLEGSMIDGENLDIPIIELHFSGGRAIARAIDGLAADPSVRAIVLRVDSGGGAVLAGDQIWRAVARARRRGKPVVASFGAIAASGGYYAAVGANEIWADPSTLTGSIGIFYGKVDVAPLAARLGVTFEIERRGRRAGVDSFFRPFTPDEREMLADRMRTLYLDFIRKVARGRGMSLREVDAVARGRIWSGDQAVRLGLVDHLGGFRAALQRARQLGGLDETAEVVFAPARPEQLLDYVLGTGSAASASPPATASIGAAVPRELRAAIAWLYTVASAHGGALALSPVALSGPE